MSQIASRTCLMIGLLAVAAFGASAARADAMPLQFGSNYYELVIVPNPFDGNNNSWFTASAAAAASTFGGVQGHLATVTSQAENDFLQSLIGSSANGTNWGAWLGGDYTQWLEGPETGQALSYTNWGGIEPNNAGILYMVIGTNSIYSAGKWADDSGVQGFPDSFADPVAGYFVEYESPDVASTVPEPATLTLLGLGLAGFRARRRITR